MIPVLAAVVCLAALFIFIIAPGTAPKAKKAPFFGRNIAHRGLHEKDQSVPENSAAAFEAAAAAGYGIELDVQLSRDGQVVVFHDDTLGRVCSVSARVDSLDYEELKKLRLFGTDESIPLFSEVLGIIGGRTPIIVELKTGPKNKELCEKTLSLLCGYSGDYCIESFDPRIVAWFRKHAPEVLRGQLSQRPKMFIKAGAGRLLSFALGNMLLNVIARPQFIAYMTGRKTLPVIICEMLGAMKVCWTSHDAANEKGCDTVIFEHYLPAARFK